MVDEAVARKLERRLEEIVQRAREKAADQQRAEERRLKAAEVELAEYERDHRRAEQNYYLAELYKNDEQIKDAQSEMELAEWRQAKVRRAHGLDAGTAAGDVITKKEVNNEQKGEMT